LGRLRLDFEGEAREEGGGRSFLNQWINRLCGPTVDCQSREETATTPKKRITTQLNAMKTWD